MSFQGDSIYWVEVEKIVPNPFQPRREFDETRLQELADSIRMYGVLQPLTVTRKEVQREDGTFYSEYELIAGERRLRASKLAGISQVPVIIRDGEQTEQEKLELAIIENLQREDLNAVDRALAFKQLADVFGLQHTQVAKKVGRSREYVSNSIRLLNLPEHVLSALRQADISEGHARTLLMLNDRPEEQDVLFREILLKKLSVREVERIARNIATEKVRAKTLASMDAALIEMEKQFTETLGTRVQIQKTDFGGKLTIDYFSVEDLESILERMRTEAQSAAGAAAASVAAAATITTHTPLTVAEAKETAEPEPAFPVEDVSRPISPEPQTFALSGESNLGVATIAPSVPDKVNADLAEAENVIANPSATPTPANPLSISDRFENDTPRPTQPVATPTPTAPVDTPVASSPAANPVRTGLAAALDRALGRVPATPPSMPSATPSSPAAVDSPIPPGVTTPQPTSAQSLVNPSPAATQPSAPTETTPAPTNQSEDDDLYSLKNFSI